MERIIKNDETILNFEISVLVNHNIFPFKDVLNKDLNVRFKNKDTKLRLHEHKLPFQHKPLFSQQSAGFGFNIKLIEFIIFFPVDYNFFIKKLSRYGSHINEKVLEEKPHWESIAISTVLRHLSIEIINKFIDSYRLLTASVSLPPITENSIIHLSYQSKTPKSISVIEDTKIGTKKIEVEPSDNLVPCLINSVRDFGKLTLETEDAFRQPLLKVLCD